MLVTARGALTASANILGDFTIAGAEVGGGGSLVADNTKIVKCAVGVLIADGADVPVSLPPPPLLLCSRRPARPTQMQSGVCL